MKCLAEGGRPTVGFNRFGFHIRAAQGTAPQPEAKVINMDGTEHTQTPEAAKPAANRFVLRPFVRIDPASLPPREWLFGHHYQRGTVSVTTSPGGFGKTSLAMVEAVSMATGRSLLGEQPDARLRVWLHNGEDQLVELHRRLCAICQQYDIPQEELEGWLFITSGTEFPLRVASGYSELRINEVLLKCINDEIARNQISCVLLDPLITLHGVSEQDNSKMDAVIRTFARVADVQDCAIGLAHHTRKQAPGAGGDYGVDDMRGASAVRDAVRAARMLNQMTVKDAEDAGVQEHERFSYFRVDKVKGNNSPPAKAVWRRLVSITLPNDDEVGVVVPWLFPGQDGPAGDMAEATRKAEAVFMQLMVRFTLEGRTVNEKQNVNYSPTVFSQEPEAIAAKAGKKILADAMRRLLKERKIAIETTGNGHHRATKLVINREGET